MAPLTPIFEFQFYGTASALEPPLNSSVARLEALAADCDSGEAYGEYYVRIRNRIRDISIPNASLDGIHRAVNRLLFPVDTAAGREVNGFVANKSVKTNADLHIGAQYLAQFDIADFFASTSASQISSALHRAGFGEAASELLSRLVCCAGMLPLGARTSPRISNIVLRELDQQLVALAEERGITYSRYADDMAFSSDKPFEVADEVEAAVASVGFSLNRRKSRSFKYGQPMYVTGLSISNPDFARLRARFKRRLRQEFYFVETRGLAAHAEWIGQASHAARIRIMGQYHFALSIEPSFAASLEVGFPSAYKQLIPERHVDRLERLLERREEFYRDVLALPPVRLSWYVPTVELGSSATISRLP